MPAFGSMAVLPHSRQEAACTVPSSLLDDIGASPVSIRCSASSRRKAFNTVRQSRRRSAYRFKVRGYQAATFPSCSVLPGLVAVLRPLPKTEGLLLTPVMAMADI